MSFFIIESICALPHKRVAPATLLGWDLKCKYSNAEEIIRISPIFLKDYEIYPTGEQRDKASDELFDLVHGLNEYLNENLYLSFENIEESTEGLTMFREDIVHQLNWAIHSLVEKYLKQYQDDKLR